MKYFVYSLNIIKRLIISRQLSNIYQTFYMGNTFACFKPSRFMLPVTLLFWMISSHPPGTDQKDKQKTMMDPCMITSVTHPRSVLSVETTMCRPSQSSSRRCLSSRLVSRWVVSHLPRSGWSTHQGKYARMPSMVFQLVWHPQTSWGSAKFLTVPCQSTGATLSPYDRLFLS